MLSWPERRGHDDPMNLWQRRKQDQAIKAATAQAASFVARNAIPEGAIDNYVAGLESILSYYSTCAADSRPGWEQIQAADVALSYARTDRLVAEKLTAFSAALATQLGVEMTQEMAFHAAAIQGELIVGHKGKISTA
jgi:hypothetical protein